MEFKIPCEVFVRLSNAALAKPNPKYENLNCVRVEHIAGKTLAIATNSAIMAVQLIGETDQPDGACNIICSDKLLDQCRTEMVFDGELSIAVFDQPGMRFASAKTTFGYQHPDTVCYFLDHDHPLTKWRRAFEGLKNDEKQPARFMFMNGEEIANLGRASPSGSFTFPAKIDATKAIVVRDTIDPDWCGVFVPWELVPKGLEAATLPDWVLG